MTVWLSIFVFIKLSHFGHLFIYSPQKKITEKENKIELILCSVGETVIVIILNASF